MVTIACVRSVMRFAPITQLGVTAEGDPPAPTPLCLKGDWQTQA